MATHASNRPRMSKSCAVARTGTGFERFPVASAAWISATNLHMTSKLAKSYAFSKPLSLQISLAWYHLKSA